MSFCHLRRVLKIFQAFWLPDTSPDTEESAKDLLKKKGMA